MYVCVCVHPRVCGVCVLNACDCVCVCVYQSVYMCMCIYRCICVYGCISVCVWVGVCVAQIFDLFQQA